MSGADDVADLIRVVLADANVLYSRVLRDYLLYAADQEIVAIAWSSEILAEVTEHLIENVEGFDQAAAQRLVGAMNRAFPYAEVEPVSRRRGNRVVHLEHQGLPSTYRRGPRLRGAHSGPVAQSARGRVRATDARRPPNGSRFAQGRH